MITPSPYFKAYLGRIRRRTYNSPGLYSNNSVISSPMRLLPSGIVSGSITSSLRSKCSAKTLRSHLSSLFCFLGVIAGCTSFALIASTSRSSSSSSTPSKDSDSYAGSSDIKRSDLRPNIIRRRLRNSSDIFRITSCRLSLRPALR